MHFDDRLATVLRQPAGSEAIARAQYRQLIDLLGTLPSEVQGDAVDAAYLRLGELSAILGASERAAILRDPALRLRSPRLVAQLALAEPSVASVTMRRAELAEEQWLDLVPALPVRARGLVRHRRGLGIALEALLARLGIADRGLPPADVDAADAPLAATDQPPQIDQIGAIVRRIEAFRKTRRLGELDPTGEAPRLPLGEADGESPPQPLDAFDFATDAENRIVWADAAVAPAVVGLRLGSPEDESPAQGSPALIAAFRHRQPIVCGALLIAGAPAVAGAWLIDAAPRFAQPGGRFVGYLGRLRRPAADSAPAPSTGEADRMRQILHELRTPVNAIQGFAEVIQQQLFGPTPHEYRALAANIAGDSARMLAGFEELDRLAKLESGALSPEPGVCDLLPILEATIVQLESFNAPRRSGFALDSDEATQPVALARAEAERLVWRLLATLAGATQPNEVLRLRARRRGDTVRLSLRLPASLAWCEDEALFHAGAGAHAQALSVGMFGTGFALRLAATEAHAAAGALERREDKLRLTLPSVANVGHGAVSAFEEPAEHAPAD